ncbi:MAG: hypothetical protein WAQ99_22890 [Pyrinomonadaceae bacterium]
MEGKKSHNRDTSGSSSGVSKQAEVNDARLTLSDLPDSHKISSLITEEVIRSRIRGLIDPTAKRSRLEAISTNPSFAVVLGFVLTGIIGGSLAYYYGLQQQELSARRSFSDEINKTRVQKLGEVWEQLDEDEFLINNILEENRLQGLNTDSAVKDKRADEIIRVINRDRSIVNKYRFWLGEHLFEMTMEYLNANIDYAVRNISSKPGADLTELSRRRDAARQNILPLRRLLLAGQPDPQEKPAGK